MRTAQLLAVVAGHEVPHHNLVGSFQREILVGEHMAVGRAEQERVENLLHIAIDVPTHFHENLRLFGISQIILGRVFKSTDMVEGVVTDAVPTLNDHPEFVRMLPYVVTYHEEGGFDVVLIQQVEHPGSYFGDRAIVESQINGFFIGVHPPDCIGI